MDAWMPVQGQVLERERLISLLAALPCRHDDRVEINGAESSSCSQGHMAPLSQPEFP